MRKGCWLFLVGAGIAFFMVGGSMVATDTALPLLDRANYIAIIAVIIGLLALILWAGLARSSVIERGENHAPDKTETYQFAGQAVMLSLMFGLFGGAVLAFDKFNLFGWIGWGAIGISVMCLAIGIGLARRYGAMQ
jgi:hypothetical protein